MMIYKLTLDGYAAASARVAKEERERLAAAKTQREILSIEGIQKGITLNIAYQPLVLAASSQLFYRWLELSQVDVLLEQPPELRSAGSPDLPLSLRLSLWSTYGLGCGRLRIADGLWAQMHYHSFAPDALPQRERYRQLLVEWVFLICRAQGLTNQMAKTIFNDRWKQRGVKIERI